MFEQVTAYITFLPEDQTHAVARVTGGDLPVDTSVTFGLAEDIWQSASPPNLNETVVLRDLRLIHTKGWRAYQARYYRPSDEEAGQDS